MTGALILLFAVLLILGLMPKVTSGRILFSENFIPELQTYRRMVDRDLSGIQVRIEIAHRKLYRIKLFAMMKPLFDMMPSAYSVKPDRKGKFYFWAYPFDIVHITIGDDRFRATFTLRHRVRDYWPRYRNIYQSLIMMFFPYLLHDECIELPTTLGKTCGYADKISLLPGEECSLYISTASETFSMQLIKVGERLESIEQKDNIQGLYQNIETKFPSALGCGWKPVMKYKMPDDLSSGCYILRLIGKDDHDRSFIPFIVRPSEVENDIAVIASTNTWHAYNSWGGQNYYINYTSFPSRYIVSTERPFDLYVRNPVNETCETSRDHLLVGERFIWSWLEREGIGYDLYSDEDLHSEEVFQSALSKYKSIIISTHNEYWSLEMVDHLKQFIKNGGNVLSLSGNTLYKEVEYKSRSTIVLDGALFRFQDLYEESILGVAHDVRGFTTWAPYKAVKADHWVFEGTNLKNGDIFGNKGLNVSPDEKPGASGWETDKLYPLTPENTQLLAKGTNPEEGGAEMILCETEGGSVFSVSSITFGGSLLVDDAVSRITKNVITKFTS